MLLTCLVMTIWTGTCPIPWTDWPDARDVAELSACAAGGGVDGCVTADAGPDDSSNAGLLYELDGTGSGAGMNPGDIVYDWVQTNGPSVTLDNAGTSTPSFMPQTEGLYVFRLDVTWNCREDSDTVSITIGPPLTPTELGLTQIASGISRPVGVRHTGPGDTRLFIVGKNGVIHVYKNGMVQPTPFLDVSGLVSSGNEQGLLGLAFDPDYATNGYFYINYTGQMPGGGGSSSTTRIVSYERDSGNPDIADPSTATLLLSVTQPHSNHNGGDLAFDPDGHLFIGMGDGGWFDDCSSTAPPNGYAQDLNFLLGKMLRIDVDGPNAYTIPAGNPFGDEIWAYGLRNPWRFSFDRATGDLFIADVGQGTWEEVNVVDPTVAGINYGWRRYEGFNCFNPSCAAANCDQTGLTDPVHAYAHGPHCSVTGGYIYRGTDLTALQGHYIFADYCSSDFWLMRFDGADWVVTDVTVLDGASPLDENINSFGEDEQGEIYICTDSGNVFMITSVLAR